MENTFIVLQYINEEKVKLHAVVNSFEDGRLFIRKVLKRHVTKVEEDYDWITHDLDFTGPTEFYQDIEASPVNYITYEGGDERIGYNFIIIGVSYWSNELITNN